MASLWPSQDIIPDLSIASLSGIRILTKAGCDVTFTKTECVVRYQGRIILQGAKDPATVLWTLPLGLGGMTSQPADKLLSVAPKVTDTHANQSLQIAFFTHTHSAYESKQYLVCTPIIVQPHHPDVAQSD